MVTTRSTSSHPNNSNTNPIQASPAHQPLNLPNTPSFDPITHQLSSIAARLDTMDALAAEVATLKAQSSNVPPAATSLGVSDKGRTKEVNRDPRDRGKNSWSEDEEDIDIPC